MVEDFPISFLKGFKYVEILKIDESLLAFKVKNNPNGKRISDEYHKP